MGPGHAAALGLVTAAWLPTLDGPALRHRLVLRYLSWRGSDARAGWTALAVTGGRSGDTFSFPMMCAPLGPSSLVVFPGHPERKSWWRNLASGSHVTVLHAGTWVSAHARLLRHGSTDWSIARAVPRALATRTCGYRSAGGRRPPSRARS